MKVKQNEKHTYPSQNDQRRDGNYAGTVYARREDNDKPSEIKPVKTKNTASKGNVKMYNLPMPMEVHAKAKMLALMEGKSLADYIISAVRKANDEAAAKYSNL